jgi:anthranilate phosphoribosyltransferase
VTWAQVLAELTARRDLTGEAASWAMGQILAGEATDAQIAAFAVTLRTKGETVDEISGLAQGMLDVATPIALTTDAVDVVGTGGDRAMTVNISTMAAMVAAATGVPVVKHGNRAASSACGTADCLEALGVALDVSPSAQAQVLADAGIVFMFAPIYHPSLRYAAGPRRELGVPTIFNFLGPLANPARPSASAIGVADERMAALMAQVIAGRGHRGLVFHGGDGLDELTTTTASRVWLVGNGQVAESHFDPADLGIAAATPESLVGGGPAHNAAVVRAVFAGETGAIRDIVQLNAAAALLAFQGPAFDEPVADQLRGPFAQAGEAIDSGAATAVLDTWIAATARAKA